MNVRSAVFVLLCLGIGSPFRLPGNGIRIVGYDAFATARGDAFVATADNPSATVYNPAGITELEGHQFRIATHALTYQVTYTAPTGRHSETDRAYHVLPQLHYTFTPASVPLAFGLAAYSPFGLSLEWPEDSGFRSVGIGGKLTYLRLNPVVACKIHHTLSIAAGPTFDHAEADLRRGLSPIPDNDELRFKGHGTDVGFTAGLLWQPYPQHAFGLTYRSATTINFRGHSDIHSAVPPMALSESASLRLPFPQIVTAGWSWRPTPAWNLEFNADWADWSVVKSLTLRQATAIPPIVLNWRSSWNYSFGATRYFGGGWRASAGYLYSENSVPDQHYTPLVPDSDRHVFTAGVGRKTKHWSWDASYGLTYGARTVRGSAPSLAGESPDGRYQFLSHSLMMSVGYHF